MNRLRFALTAPLLALLLLLTPAWAEDVSDLRARLTAAGAHVVEVQPSDPRLRDGKVTVGVGPDGRVEVYLRRGGTWSAQTAALSRFGDPGDEFGRSVHTSGNCSALSSESFDDLDVGRRKVHP